MKLQTLIPILWTVDFDSTVHFYRDVIGLELYELNTEWGWASLGSGSVGIMISKPNAHIEFTKPEFTGSFYFKVEDAAGWYQRLKDQAKICYPIEDFEYGMREFAVYDNNGYLLQFGEELTGG